MYFGLFLERSGLLLERIGLLLERRGLLLERCGLLLERCGLPLEGIGLLQVEFLDDMDNPDWSLDHNGCIKMVPKVLKIVIGFGIF